MRSQWREHPGLMCIDSGQFSWKWTSSVQAQKSIRAVCDLCVRMCQRLCFPLGSLFPSRFTVEMESQLPMKIHEPKRKQESQGQESTIATNVGAAVYVAGCAESRACISSHDCRGNRVPWYNYYPICQEPMLSEARGHRCIRWQT